MSQEQSTSYTNKEFIKDTLIFLKPYYSKFWLATIIMVVAHTVWLYNAIAYSEIINFFADFTQGDSLKPFWIIIFIWGGVIIFREVGRRIGRYIVYSLSESLRLDVYRKAWLRSLALDLHWHQKENTGNRIKRIQGGSKGIDKVLRIWIGPFLDFVVNVGGVIIVLATFDLVLSGLMLVFMVIHFLLSRYFFGQGAKATHRVNIAEEELTGTAYEGISNIRTVKVMSMTRTLRSRIERQIAAVFFEIKRRIAWFQAGSLAVNLFALLGRIGIFVYAGLGVASGKFEIGVIALVFAYFGRVWMASNNLSDAVRDFLTVKYSVMRIVDIFQTPITIDDETGKKKFPKTWEDITLDNISFQYEDRPVLKDISFTIKRGEKVGLVGLSGAGKSTLMKLLLKEYEAQSGTITIGGQSITETSKQDYFKHVAVVLQDTEVFNLSLKDNIVMARPDYKPRRDKQMFINALDIAHVNDFVPKLPKGIDTLIGEKGVKLSGGERQRVGLARAIFKEPQVFFLDEATSHLDVESEQKIQESLHEFFQGVTAVVIAHRLTTIKEMDRILVMQEGEIIEQGTFSELIAAKGRFAELWEKQQL